MTIIDIQPELEIRAPMLPVAGSIKPPKTKIDLVEVERLAGLGLKPAAIGPLLGLPVRTFYYHWEKKAAVRDAYDRGNSQWQLTLVNTIKEKAVLNKKDIIALIFSLKQAHGAAWSDGAKPQTADQESEAQKRFLKNRRADKRKLRLGGQDVEVAEVRELTAGEGAALEVVGESRVGDRAE